MEIIGHVRQLYGYAESMSPDAVLDAAEARDGLSSAGSRFSRARRILSEWYPLVTPDIADEDEAVAHHTPLPRY